jgi:hypothetical protein
MSVGGVFGFNGLSVTNPTVLIHSIADFCSIENRCFDLTKVSSFYLRLRNTFY